MAHHWSEVMQTCGLQACRSLLVYGKRAYLGSADYTCSANDTESANADVECLQNHVARWESSSVAASL